MFFFRFFFFGSTEETHKQTKKPAADKNVKSVRCKKIMMFLNVTHETNTKATPCVWQLLLRFLVTPSFSFFTDTSCWGRCAPDIHSTLVDGAYSRMGGCKFPHHRLTIKLFEVFIILHSGPQTFKNCTVALSETCLKAVTILFFCFVRKESISHVFIRPLGYTQRVLMSNAQWQKKSSQHL